MMQAFQPLPWQIPAWRNKAPTLLLTGSAGGGKSRLAAEKLHAYLLKYPRATGLALRKTRDSMVNSTVLLLESTVIGHSRRIIHHPTRHRFEYPNGSILCYGGMADDAQREQIRSIGLQGGLDIAWMEEATRFTEADYNELLTRMRGTAAPWRQIMLSTNPDSPSHWINRRLIQGGEATVFYSRAGDNATLPTDYQAALDHLTGKERARLRDGRWTQAEGAIWPEWDPEIHVVPRFEIPSQWPAIIAVDFGYTNPFVAQLWRTDPDGRMFLTHEVYHTKRTVNAHAPTIKAWVDLHPGAAIVADHDAEDRATLAESGIWTRPANKDVQPGLQAVRERLAVAGDGRPRLFILAQACLETDPLLDSQLRPTSTEQEIPGYVWASAPDGRPLPETPAKIHDHGCDAMRYAVMAADSGETVQYLPPKM